VKSLWGRRSSKDTGAPRDLLPHPAADGRCAARLPHPSREAPTRERPRPLVISGVCAVFLLQARSGEGRFGGVRETNNGYASWRIGRGDASGWGDRRASDAARWPERAYSRDRAGGHLHRCRHRSRRRRCRPLLLLLLPLLGPVSPLWRLALAFRARAGSPLRLLLTVRVVRGLMCSTQAGGTTVGATTAAQVRFILLAMREGRGMFAGTGRARTRLLGDAARGEGGGSEAGLRAGLRRGLRGLRSGGIFGA
jgi:hypothetical protein